MKFKFQTIVKMYITKLNTYKILINFDLKVFLFQKWVFRNCRIEFFEKIKIKFNYIQNIYFQSFPLKNKVAFIICDMQNGIYQLMEQY